MSHIAVERKRRRQMNEHLKVLRTLTPAFYIKRGDQASIIGGAIEFIKELHLVLRSLESKKQRTQVCNSSSSSTKSSLSPVSPPSATAAGTYNPSQTSPQKLLQRYYYSTPDVARDRRCESSFLTPSTANPQNLSKELGACCSSPVADVEAKISGSNVILKVLSKRIPSQVIKIIAHLECLDFEVLHLNISTMANTVLYSFVIKIGLDCQLSVEELVLEVQRCFSTTLDSAAYAC